MLIRQAQVAQEGGWLVLRAQVSSQGKETECFYSVPERFAEFADTNKAVRTTIDKNFVYIHINYSKGHTNPEAMKFLDNPARFGFPVFVILDQEGKRLHTQNSAYLEEGKGYSEKKVNEFLLNWTPEAVNTLK